MKIPVFTTLTLLLGFVLSTYAAPIQLTGFDVGGTSSVSTAGAFTVTTTSTAGATPTVYGFTKTGNLDGGTIDDTLTFDFVYTIYTGSSISGTDVTLGALSPLASGSVDPHFMQDYVGDPNLGALEVGNSFTVVIQNIVYTDGEGDGEVATFSGFDAVTKFGGGDAAVLIGTADASSVPVDAATGSVIPLGGVPDLTLTTSITSGATVQRLRDLAFSFEIAQPIIETGDLILHYRFDGDLLDSSSSANDGTTNLGVISSAAEDVAYGSGALSLRGQTDSDVDLATPIVFTASDPWSAAFWSKRAALDDNRGMVMGDTSNRVDYIWLNEVTAPTGLTFKSTSSKTFNFEVTHDLDYHHYALVADGAGNLTLYRDGSFQQTVTVTGGDTSFRITSIGNGFDTNARSVNGQLDEVRIYSKELTASEVGSIYTIETSEPPTPPGIARVFFMAGQSNMLGYGDSAELTSPYKDPLPNVRYWNGANWVDLRTGFGRATDFGPEIYFGHILDEALPTDTIYLVKFAVGGTSLWDHWAPNTGIWHTEFVSRATGALARLEADGVDYEVSAMLWLQGESDAADNKGALYEANLRGFITDMRTRFGISDLPFYLGRIRDYYGSTNQNNLVRNAQVAVADSTINVEWFDTDGFGDLIDGGHYDANGQAQVGSAYANIYLAHLNGTANVAPVFAVDPINEANATEDIAYVGSVANATDSDGDPLTYSKLTGPAWLLVATDGSLSGTPAQSDAGANVFTVQVDDGYGGTDSATLNITVDAVNDAPVFTADPINEANATEDIAYAGSVGNATDAEGDTLSYSKLTGPAWLSVGTDGSLSGTPAQSDTGANVFTVQVDDGNGGTDTATLNITVDEFIVADLAVSGLQTLGTSSGTLADTFASDDVYQVLTESGDPSALEYEWTFNVFGSELVTFDVEAYHTANSEGDDFVFAYSINGTDYIDMVTVTDTVDNDTKVWYALPGGTSGTVYVRVLDADRTSGNTVADSLYVDEIMIVSEDSTVAPAAATVPAPSDGAVDVAVNVELSWTAGQMSASHDVYFGTNPTPDAAEFMGNQSGVTFDPGVLAYSTIYYWAIDEVNLTGTTSGPVWSFTTAAPGNTAPQFDSDPVVEAAATENTVYNATLVDDASDVDSDPMTFSKVSGPAWLNVASDGTLSGTPLNENVGLNSWTVQVSDGVDSSIATLEITVQVAQPGWTELTNDDFEGSFGNWMDGGSDVRLASINAIDSQCIEIQDNSVWSEVELSNSLDLTSYSELRIEFSYVVKSFERSEDFWVRFSDNGGLSWTTIKAYVNDVDFVDDGTRYPVELTIDSSSYTFSNDVKIMFECDASANNDDVYIDNVIISAQ